jgi:hypothetical protein
MKNFLLALVFLTTSFTIKAEEIPTPDIIDNVWDALSVFEGSYKTVTGDFDCQGMSIGVAQWNVGKSFPSVKKIIYSNTEDEIKRIMPNYGESTIKTFNEGKESAYKFIRAFQNIKNPDSCVATERKATWNANGKIFSKELSTLLLNKASIDTQKLLRQKIFIDGWRNANKWASVYHGQSEKPSLKEIAYFVDMQIFNGGGLDKFGIKYKKIPNDDVPQTLNLAINYLTNANDDFLLHKIAARKNAKLLKVDTLNESEAALFSNAYHVAKSISKPYAKQFRLTVINRRAAILFGEAYYSDKDDAPTKIVLH